MATIIANGRRITIPDTATTEEIQAAAGIKPGRTLIHRKREGNFRVKPGSSVNVNEGDVFVDAPPRVKG